MSPDMKPDDLTPVRFPRVSGDEPRRYPGVYADMAFSPRERG